MPSTSVTRTVLVDATKLADAGMDGTKRYALEMLRAMAELGDRPRDLRIEVSLDGFHGIPLDDVAPHLTDDKVTAGLALGAAPRSVPMKQPIRDLSGLWSEANRFRRRLHRSLWKRWQSLAGPKREHDLIHLTLPSTWRLYAGQRGQRLVTVHDLSHVICPEHQTESNRRTLAHGLQSACREKARFLAVSRSTARDFAASAGLPLDQIPVIHEACRREVFHASSTPERRAEVRKRLGIPPGPFILTLSRIEPRKNLIGIVRACRRLRQERPDLAFSLVLAGGPGWGDSRPLEAETSGCDWIRRTGHVDESDLAALYSEASCSGCLSFYEGFCLPALESLSCGCPVVFSDRSAIPEVVGDAGLSASPTDIDSIAGAFRRILADRSLREELSRRALRRSEEFSWRENARQTVALYEDMLFRQPAQRGAEPTVSGRRRVSLASRIAVTASSEVCHP